MKRFLPWVILLLVGLVLHYVLERPVEGAIIVFATLAVDVAVDMIIAKWREGRE